jgi:hypothetical protein
MGRCQFYQQLDEQKSGDSMNEQWLMVQVQDRIQDIHREAEQRRLVSEARGSRPAKRSYRFSFVGLRFRLLPRIDQEPVRPGILANRG